MRAKGNLKRPSYVPSGCFREVKSPLFDGYSKGLVTNYGEGGGLQNGKGGAREVFAKRGHGKSFSHAEGGAQNVLGSFYAVA